MQDFVTGTAWRNVNSGFVAFCLTLEGGALLTASLSPSIYHKLATMITNMLQNTTHKTEAMVSSSNNTAISLWHKFATWQNEMDQCRMLVRTICDEQDQIRTQMKDLLHVRQEERRKIKDMEEINSCVNESSDSSEIPSLERLRELQRKLDDVEEQHRSANASYEITKQKEQHQKRSQQDIIQEFLEASRSFHLKCRRAQYDLTVTTVAATPPTEPFVSDPYDTVGTSCRAHTLHAALCAKGAEKHTGAGNVEDDNWMSKTIESLQNSNMLQSTILQDFDESTDESDPSTWKINKEKDFELYRSVELYKQQLEKFTFVEKETEQLQSKYDALHTKGLDRDRRTMKLQTQLQRIQNDCTLLESEIDQCMEMISEDEALATTYRSSEFQLLICFVPICKMVLSRHNPLHFFHCFAFPHSPLQ